MTVISHSPESTSPSVAVIDDLASIATFLDPTCAAAIWRRQCPSHVQTWLDALDPEVLPRGRIAVPAREIADTVEQLCASSGLPIGSERDWLQQDIVALAEAFSTLMKVEFLRLRLEAITSNACRRFHKDAITGRLICTYRGTGTQYGVSTDGTDPKAIFTVQTGAPILLRGSLWPEEPPSGTLHRSPPIEGTGETRLVLVLDPVFDPEDLE